VAFAAAGGPKRREALATGARHQKLDAVFLLSYLRRKAASLAKSLTETICHAVRRHLKTPI
jgi:hypothetical protein